MSEIPNYGQAMAIKEELHYAQGLTAAQAYPLMPGVRGIFFDPSTTKFYIKTVDFNGRPSPTKSYTYSEDEPVVPENNSPNFVTVDQFQQAMKELSDKIDNLSYKKPNNYRGGKNNVRSKQ